MLIMRFKTSDKALIPEIKTLGNQLLIPAVGDVIRLAKSTDGDMPTYYGRYEVQGREITYYYADREQPITKIELKIERLKN